MDANQLKAGMPTLMRAKQKRWARARCVKLCPIDGISLTIIILVSRMMGYSSLLPNNSALPVYLSGLICRDVEQNERFLIFLIRLICPVTRCGRFRLRQIEQEEPSLTGVFAGQVSVAAHVFEEDLKERFVFKIGSHIGIAQSAERQDNLRNGREV